MPELIVKIEWDEESGALSLKDVECALYDYLAHNPKGWFRVTEYVPEREEIDARSEEINLREAALEAEERGYKEGYREGQQDREREA